MDSGLFQGRFCEVNVTDSNKLSRNSTFSADDRYATSISDNKTLIQNDEFLSPKLQWAAVNLSSFQRIRK